MKRFLKCLVATMASAGVLASTQAQTNFTGSYTQNFDAALTNSGTVIPPGFTSMVIAGANSTYVASSPITAAGIAAATADTQSLTVWNVGTAVASSGTKSFNIGCWDGLSDRALGTDPTGTAAQVIQLSLSNNTGSTLYGVTFSYACKCLTNGSAGTEESELPGYCFFYSTTGTNSASYWTEVGVAGTAALVGGVPTANGLCLPNFTQGTTMSSGPVNITFATPLTNNGVMYFRWADDNNEASSPDQMIAIDNISITTYNPSGPVVSLVSPTNSQNFLPTAGIPLSATASDLSATVTNVSFYANATNLLGNLTNSPYTVTVSNLSIGNYALTAVALDSTGLAATSAVVNITVAHTAPTVSLTSPVSGSGYSSPAAIALAATAAGTDGTVTNVGFYQGSTLLANVAASPYTYSWSNVTAGSYTLTAQATDNHGLTTTSSSVAVTVTNSTTGVFTGVYNENFDSDLSNSTTTMPPGFTSQYLNGSHFTYTNAPGLLIDSNAMATNVFAGTQTLVVWNFGTAVTKEEYQLLNVGSDGNVNDRALGSDPTGTAGNVIQLALSNNTGGSLAGLTFSYTEKCLTNGSTSNGSYTDDGTERLELPGYSFFYSLVGDTNATNWIYVQALSLTNWVQGTQSNSGPVALTFPAPLTNGGVMYFRWADDNCVASSPDQMYAIDNISIATYNPTGPLVSIASPAGGATFLPGSSIAISAVVSDSSAPVTNIEFFANSTDLGGATSTPYTVTLPNAALGSYALTAVASDSAGLTSTSAVVTISVAHTAPTITLTSPLNGESYTAPAGIVLSANAAGTDGTVTNVAFFQGSTLLANIPSAPYNYDWVNVPAGSYTLTALAKDNNGLTTASASVTVTVSNSTTTVYTGIYSENFDSDLSNSTTVLPPGFSAFYLPGSHFTYTNTPGETIDSNAIVTATVGSGASTLVVWNAGAAVADASYQLFNVGSWDTLNDRALGTDPTGTGGTVIQLAMTNTTGASLPGIVFSYTEKCLTNGSTSNGSYTDDGTERLELPGYAFFYSTVGDTNASNWFYVQALSLTNWVQGTQSNSGPVTLTFPAPLTNGGVMYFRWADDNCVASSPDQMYAIDNVSISNINTAAPTNYFYAGYYAGLGFVSGFNLITTNVAGLGLSTFSSTNPLTPIANWTLEGLMYEQPLNDGTGRSYYSINLNPTVSPTYYLIGQSNVAPLAPTGTVEYVTTPDFTDYTLSTNTVAISNGVLQFPVPVVSLASPTNGSTYIVGTPISIVANVTDSLTNITSVSFYIDGSYLLTTLASAPYTFTLPGSVPANTYILTAVATDALGNATTSAPVTVTVSTLTPVVSLTSPTNGQNFLPGSAIALSAAASENGGSISNVAFYAGSNLLANVAAAPYNYTWTNAGNGSYALTAVATDAVGNVVTSSVVNITVANAFPVVSITSPANGAGFTSGSTIVVTATASESGGAISNVTFYENSTLLGVVTSAPYSFSWTNVSAGAYTLTAVAKDVFGTTVTSGGVSLLVTNNSSLATLQQIKTFFIIPLENHDFVQANPTGSPEQLFGNPACPYFNSLITPGNSNAAQTAYATHYYSVAINGEHPSEPNYVWSEAGTDFGVRTDNDPSTGSGNLFSGVQHLSAQMTAAGVVWKDYQEDVQYSSSPAVSASGGNGSVNPYNGTTEYSYAVKHNPMEFFTDTQGKNVYPLSQFWIDLTNNNVGRYNWVTPDQYNEMHSSLPGGYTYHGVAYTGDQAAIAEGDNFLSIVIPQIMASQAYKSNGVIIIWTDETESTDDTNTTLPYVIISPLAKGNAYASTLPYNHSSDLKTMDEVFGLAFQTNAIPAAELDAQDTAYNYVDGHSATIYDLSDFFTPPVVSYTAPSITGSKLLNGTNGFQLTFSGPSGQAYQVLASDSIKTPKSGWTVLTSGTFGSTNVVYTDTRSLSSSNRFYVVKSP